MPAELARKEVHIRAGKVAQVIGDVASAFDVSCRKLKQDRCTRPLTEKRMVTQRAPDFDTGILAKQFDSRLINVVHAGDRAANLPGGVPRKMAEEALVTGSIIKMADEPDNGFVADLLIENTSAFAFYQ